MKPLLCTSALVLALMLGSSVPSSLHSQEAPATPVETPAPAASADAPAAAPSEDDQQKAFMEVYNKMPWQNEGVAKIGEYAEIKIQPGFRFLPKEHTAQWMKFTGNLPSDRVMGIYEKADQSWTAVYQYEDSGHVKDDEKNDLDADKLLKVRKEQSVASNSERVRRGLGSMTLIDWSMKPRYNQSTNNLEWGLRYQVEGGETINHTTKMLSKTGIMDVVLICSPQEIDQVMPEYQTSLSNFSFVSGHKYAEYKKGDKLATYGLTALAAGTGVAVLAKTGLLAKFFGLFAKAGKIVIAVIAGIFIGIFKLFGFMKNRKASQE